MIAVWSAMLDVCVVYCLLLALLVVGAGCVDCCLLFPLRCVLCVACCLLCAVCV